MKQFIVLSILLILSNCTPSIEQINYAVNRVPYKDYYPASDKDFYTNGGNCTGYAMTKWIELHKNGYKSANMKWVMYKGQMHVVVVVNNLVLDNIVKDVQPLSYLQTFDKVF